MAKKKRAATKAKADSKSVVDADSTFEEAMEELESIVNALESGQTSLGDSLQRFERGMSLLRHCHQQLEHTAQRIEVLTGINDDGTVETATFDGSATADSSSQKVQQRDQPDTSSGAGDSLF